MKVGDFVVHGKRPLAAALRRARSTLLVWESNEHKSGGGTTLVGSTWEQMRKLRFVRWSYLAWPMIGSTAKRRRKSTARSALRRRRLALVVNAEGFQTLSYALLGQFTPFLRGKASDGTSGTFSEFCCSNLRKLHFGTILSKK